MNAGYTYVEFTAQIKIIVHGIFTTEKNRESLHHPFKFPFSDSDYLSYVEYSVSL